MSAAPTPEELFFRLFESLPRQGPGSKRSTERALRMCAALPPAPAVLDLGCGSGTQTCDLASMLDGDIVAVDMHSPFIDALTASAAERGFADRLTACLGDIAETPEAAESFDLVWSEGALYNLGIPRALEVARGHLRRGGYLAFTEAVWRVDDPPAEASALFEEYPGMGRVDDVIAAAAGEWELIGHFPLPDQDWWEDFYTPMEARIAELREEYGGDEQTKCVLDQLAAEPELHRTHGDSYGYEFFVLRKR